MLHYQCLHFSEILPVGKKDGLVAVPSHYEEKDIHGIIGMSLVLGFLFMLLIDQISSSRSKGYYTSFFK